MRGEEQEIPACGCQTHLLHRPCQNTCKVAKIPIQIRIGEKGEKDSSIGMFQFESVIKNYNYIGGEIKKNKAKRVHLIWHLDGKGEKHLFHHTEIFYIHSHRRSVE